MSEVDELLGAMKSGANEIADAAPALSDDVLRLIAAVEHERKARNELLDENHREIVCLETARHLADNELAAILRGESDA